MAWHGIAWHEKKKKTIKKTPQKRDKIKRSKGEKPSEVRVYNILTVLTVLIQYSKFNVRGLKKIIKKEGKA